MAAQLSGRLFEFYIIAQLFGVYSGVEQYFLILVGTGL